MAENIIRINADKFIEAWMKFSDKFTTTNKKWKVWYENNFRWSDKFLGDKKSSSTNSPIGNYFKKHFKGLRYRTEDGSFDLAFSFAKNFSKIPYITKRKIAHFNLDKQFYPNSYDIIVEIENESVCAWQEMTKLTWVRCPLKVLVTYKNKTEKENEMLVESFTKIISQSNKNFKDNLSTEYLLIFGNKIEGNLEWTFTKFDSDGKVILAT